MNLLCAREIEISLWIYCARGKLKVSLWIYCARGKLKSYCESTMREWNWKSTMPSTARGTLKFHCAINYALGNLKPTNVLCAGKLKISCAIYCGKLKSYCVIYCALGNWKTLVLSTVGNWKSTVLSTVFLEIENPPLSIVLCEIEIVNLELLCSSTAK